MPFDWTKNLVYFSLYPPPYHSHPYLLYSSTRLLAINLVSKLGFFKNLRIWTCQWSWLPIRNGVILLILHWNSPYSFSGWLLKMSLVWRLNNVAWSGFFSDLKLSWPHRPYYVLFSVSLSKFRKKMSQQLEPRCRPNLIAEYHFSYFSLLNFWSNWNFNQRSRENCPSFVNRAVFKWVLKLYRLIISYCKNLKLNDCSSTIYSPWKIQKRQSYWVRTSLRRVLCECVYACGFSDNRNEKNVEGAKLQSMNEKPFSLYTIFLN